MCFIAGVQICFALFFGDADGVSKNIFFLLLIINIFFFYSEYLISILYIFCFVPNIFVLKWCFVLISLLLFFSDIFLFVKGFWVFLSTNDLSFGICQIIEIIYFEKFMPMKGNWYFVLVKHLILLKINTQKNIFLNSKF